MITKLSLKDFSVGDRVRCIDGHDSYNINGKSGTVVAIEYGYLRVLFDGDTLPGGWNPSRFEVLNKEEKKWLTQTAIDEAFKYLKDIGADKKIESPPETIQQEPKKPERDQSLHKVGQGYKTDEEIWAAVRAFGDGKI